MHIRLLHGAPEGVRGRLLDKEGVMRQARGGSVGGEMQKEPHA